MGTGELSGKSNEMLGVTLGSTSIPSRGSDDTSPHAVETGISSGWTVLLARLQPFSCVLAVF